MNTQPEALLLAAELDPLGGAESEAAAELRRLHELNQELVEALKDLREAIKSRGIISTVKALSKTDAALAKASGSVTQTGETE